LAISLGIKRLLVYGDSLLVVQQVNKEWDCNKEMMEEVRKLEKNFPVWRFIMWYVSITLVWTYCAS
jgi:ribonuclease HI